MSHYMLEGIKTEPEDSPFMFVECSSPTTLSGPVTPSGLYSDNDLPSTSSPSQSTPRTSSPTRRPRPSSARRNYGSEPESGDSDDGEVPAPPQLIPRPYRVADLYDAEDDIDTTPEELFVERSFVVRELLEATEANQHKPIDMYDFQWEPFPNPPIHPQSRREIFSQYYGPTTPCVDAYDNFTAIWDRQIMEHIASETNRYAQACAFQMLEDGFLRPSSRICDWRDTTADELYIYFALVLALGIVVKGSVAEYWNANADIFQTPGFSAYMSLRRFQLLSKCLHFNNNENMCALELGASEAKLFKIQPIITHLNNKFQTLYKMRQNLALDESLLQWAGWPDIDQLIPNRTAPVEIKSYELCESQTGYLWRFEIHSYRSDHPPQFQSDPMNASTPSIVLRLIQGLENKGHTLWMDNFYNSPALARKLKSLQIDCVGTVRINCQFVPESLTVLNMRPGEITGFTSGDVDLMVWWYRNKVAMISTYHGNGIINESGTSKPILIRDYTKAMGGVDQKDQMLATYPVERTRTKVWYKKLFRRLLNVSVLNTFILASQSSSSMSHRTFRHCLIKQLLEKHSKPIQFNVPFHSTSQFYEAKVHHIAENEFLSNQTSRPRRLCHICKRRCTTHCAGCNKAVCISPCFVSLHHT